MQLRALATALALVVGAAPALVMGAAPAAWASSLPKVDFGPSASFGFGVGTNQLWQTGGSLSLDVPVTDSILIGGAAATNLDGSVNFDVRGLYRLIEGGTEGPTIAAMIGLWGAPGGPNAANFQLPYPVAPLVGFGLAYPVMDKVDLRLNLAYSPFFTYTGEFLTFIGGPPSSGVEVGYQLTPNMEVTLGINGRGDFLGANLTF